MAENSTFSLLLSLMLIIVLFEYGSADGRKLRPNEERIEGGAACQITCEGLNQPCCVNFFAPVTAYYCKEGYARRTCDGKCILIESDECQQKILPEEPIDCDANPPATTYQ